jgi:hypothetical protein
MDSDDAGSRQMGLTKRELKERVRELNTLMADWDPTGVIGESHAPRDEYECLVGPLLTLLQSGANEVAIGRYLSKQLVEHFGVSANQKDVAAVAARVHRWFASINGVRE